MDFFILNNLGEYFSSINVKILMKFDDIRILKLKFSNFLIF